MPTDRGTSPAARGDVRDVAEARPSDPLPVAAAGRPGPFPGVPTHDAAAPDLSVTVPLPAGCQGRTSRAAPEAFSACSAAVAADNTGARLPPRRCRCTPSSLRPWLLWPSIAGPAVAALVTLVVGIARSFGRA
jgi:hypothetical protein